MTISEVLCVIPPFRFVEFKITLMKLLYSYTSIIKYSLNTPFKKLDFQEDLFKLHRVFQHKYNSKLCNCGQILTRAFSKVEGHHTQEDNFKMFNFDLILGKT